MGGPPQSVREWVVLTGKVEEAKGSMSTDTVGRLVTLLSSPGSCWYDLTWSTPAIDFPEGWTSWHLPSASNKKKILPRSRQFWDRL